VGAAAALASTLGRRRCEVVLLGSVATPKYLVPFGAALGARLRYPEAFVGRGDMSRGALLLRSVRDGTPLTYVTAGMGFAASALMMDARPRRDIESAPKGTHVRRSADVPERQWTSDATEQECATLHAARADAVSRGDEDAVQLIDARLRLLTDCD
jgi:hypothetical protein